jgi:hypothetical protein
MSSDQKLDDIYLCSWMEIQEFFEALVSFNVTETKRHRKLIDVVFPALLFRRTLCRLPAQYI